MRLGPSWQKSRLYSETLRIHQLHSLILRCFDCFDPSQGGCCDCGDLAAWKIGGCCTRHRPTEAAERLPEAEEKEVGPAIRTLVLCLGLYLAQIGACLITELKGYSKNLLECEIVLELLFLYQLLVVVIV